jgi:hypothetical protein
VAGKVQDARLFDEEAKSKGEAGHEAELAKLAGQKVTVKGTLKGDTLSVQEVTASK